MSQETAAHVWLVLFRAAHAINRNASKSIVALKLSISEFGVLEVLLHKGPLPVSDIGRKVLLASGSITAAIDRLEERKLVERVADKNDLRARIVHLTAAGRKLIQEAFDQHSLDMEETMGVLRPREREQLVKLLKKVGLWAAARADAEDQH